MTINTEQHLSLVTLHCLPLVVTMTITEVLSAALVQSLLMVLVLKNIAAGNSDFGSVVISGTGAFTVTENATSTNSWTLTNHSNFTVNSGVTLAVGGTFTNSLGGAATTWTGSTLRLFGGGNRNLNASTTIDSYENLQAAAGTYIRMWNSDAVSYLTEATSGIYSQDHANTDGDLYIFGNFTSSSTADHWSYATDFDGTSLIGGAETGKCSNCFWRKRNLDWR